jgi:hypothetical protein
MLNLELGAPRLAYGFALATSTLVDSLQRGFYPSWRGGDGGKVNVSTTEEGGRLSYRPFRPLP